MPPAPDRRKGVALAFLCLLLLGAMPLIAAHRPAGSGGLTFALGLTLWQLVAALPLFLTERARSSARPSRPRPSRGVTATALLTGAMFAVSTLMYVVAADRAGPVDMAIALQAYPFIAMAMEGAALGRSRSRAEIGWALVMCAALVWLITGGTLSAARISPWLLFTLGIPVLWSAAHLMLRGALAAAALTPSEVTVTRLTISAVVLLALHLALEPFGVLVAAAGDPGFQTAAAVMGLAYYLELILWFSAIRHIDVSLGSSVTVPAPAVTLALSAILFATPVAPYQLVSLLVVMGALFGLLRAGRK